jgi:hypothetical protein
MPVLKNLAILAGHRAAHPVYKYSFWGTIVEHLAALYCAFS